MFICNGQLGYSSSQGFGVLTPSKLKNIEVKDKSERRSERGKKVVIERSKISQKEVKERSTRLQQFSKIVSQRNVIYKSKRGKKKVRNK